MLLRDLLLACVLVAVLAASALAQTTLHYRERQPVQPEEVQRILQDPAGSATRDVPRGGGARLGDARRRRLTRSREDPRQALQLP